MSGRAIFPGSLPPAAPYCHFVLHGFRLEVFLQLYLFDQLLYLIGKFVQHVAGDDEISKITLSTLGLLR